MPSAVRGAPEVATYRTPLSAKEAVNLHQSGSLAETLYCRQAGVPEKPNQLTELRTSPGSEIPARSSGGDARNAPTAKLRRESNHKKKPRRTRERSGGAGTEERPN